MTSYYQSFDSAWNTAVQYISSAANSLQNNVSWSTLQHSLTQLSAVVPLDISLHKAQELVGLEITEKSAVIQATEMVYAAGAKVRDFNQDMLQSAYGTLCDMADDCSFEMKQYLHDTVVWLRGDDPYPPHFGYSSEANALFEQPLSTQGTQTMWEWIMGTRATEVDW